MKTNNEILDEFGKLVVNEVVDRIYRGIEEEIFTGFKNPTMKIYGTIFKKLDTSDKELLKKYIVMNNHSIIFDFLRIFEENEQFKIIYQENGKQVNLVEISEMLKAEPIIENGWIARFSKEVKDDEII